MHACGRFAVCAACPGFSEVRGPVADGCASCARARCSVLRTPTIETSELSELKRLIDVLRLSHAQVGMQVRQRVRRAK